MNHYHAFGLHIASDLNLPALQPEIATNSNGSVKTIDCMIRVNHVDPTGLAHPSKKGVTYQASPGYFWLAVPRIGRFLVEKGHTITIDPDPESDEESIRLFTMGPCLSALLLQQGKIVFNGETMVNESKAYALTGFAGTGKSVLAKALTNQGQYLLSTEFSVINTDGEALSGYPEIQLWSDAIRLLSLPKPQHRIRPIIEKWYVSAKDMFKTTSFPLEKIYILETHNKNELQLKPLQGIAKFNALRAHTAHSSTLSSFIDFRQYQLQMAALASRLHITKIIRADKENSVQMLVDMISQAKEKEEVSA